MSTATEPQRIAARVAPPAAHSLRALVERNLRDRRRAPLTWGGSLGLLCALIVTIWPSIEHSISKAVETYPKGLKEAFGIQQLNGVEAYLDAEMFSLIVPLAVAFFAVRVIVAAVPLAEEQGYLDTLLSAPVSRRVLMAGAFVSSALASAAVLVVVAALTCIAGALAGTGISVGLVVAGVASVWSLAVFFAGVAGLAAGALHKSSAVTALATGTLVGMYVLNIAGKVAPGLHALRDVSAFRYYGSPVRDGLDPAGFAGLTLAGLALAMAGAWLFARRDVL